MFIYNSLVINTSKAIHIGSFDNGQSIQLDGQRLPISGSGSRQSSQHGRRRKSFDSSGIGKDWTCESVIMKRSKKVTKIKMKGLKFARIFK